MAKTTGALYSIGASGTFADLITFNASNNNPTARFKPRHYPAATMPQQTIRSKCTDAASAWKALPTTERAEWSLIAKNAGHLPFAKYLTEWIAQAATTATPPFIPVR